MPTYDFQLELWLKKKNGDLANRHSGCMSLFEQMLKRFSSVFPSFTDHTLLHTMNVTNISNQLLRDEAEKLNADEIYIYLMSSAMHDIGMGVSDKDLDPFIDELNLRDYVNAHPEIPKPELIRMFHHDFSAAFVKKYWHILEIPNERYAYAIAEVSRGHRKADLMDEALYSVAYDLGEGKQVNLAMLAALLRLADELDIGADRNPELLYSPEGFEGINAESLFEFSKHRAIRLVDFVEDTIVILAETDKANIEEGVISVVRKSEETLDYCVEVINKRGNIRLDFTRIELMINGKKVDLS